VTGHSSAAQVGSMAPRFRVPTLTGSDLAAPTGRPILLYFMAGWCGSCVPEAEALGQAQRTLEGKATLGAVDADPTDSWSSLRSFADTVGSPDYTFAKDDGRLDQVFGVSALDTTVVLDPSGRVVYRHIGVLDFAGVRSALASVDVRV
jgi:thiol-disulfide isomerase/thioredoxin